MSQDHGRWAELVDRLCAPLTTLPAHWDEFVALLRGEPGVTRLSESFRSGGLAELQDQRIEIVTRVFAKLAGALVAAGQAGRVKGLPDEDMCGRDPVVALLRRGLAVAERYPQALQRDHKLREAIVAVMTDPAALDALKDMREEILVVPSPATELTDRGSRWVRTLYHLEPLPGASVRAIPTDVVMPSAEWLHEAAVRVQGFLRACRRAALAESANGEPTYRGDPVAPEFLLERLFHLEEHFWTYRIGSAVGWSVLQLGDIEQCLCRLMETTRDVFVSWGVGRLFAVRGSFSVRIQQGAGFTVYTLMRSIGSPVEQVTTHAPFATLRANWVAALDACVCDLKELEAEQPALLRGMRFVAEDGALFVAAGDNAEEADKARSPVGPLCVTEKCGAEQKSESPGEETDTPVCQTEKGKRPSKSRAAEIIAAIRCAKQPLLAKEIKINIGLKRSYGSLKHHLTWMVQESKELEKVPGRGYWLAGEDVPPENAT